MFPLTIQRGALTVHPYTVRELVGTGRFELPTPRTPSEIKPDKATECGIKRLRGFYSGGEFYGSGSTDTRTFFVSENSARSIILTHQGAATVCVNF